MADLTTSATTTESPPSYIDYESIAQKGKVGITVPGPNIDAGEVGTTPTELGGTYEAYLPVREQDGSFKQGYFINWTGKNKFFKENEGSNSFANTLSGRYAFFAKPLAGYLTVKAGMDQSKAANPDYALCAADDTECEETTPYNSGFNFLTGAEYLYYRNGEVSGNLPLFGLTYETAYALQPEPFGFKEHGLTLAFNDKPSFLPGWYLQGALSFNADRGSGFSVPEDNVYTPGADIGITINPDRQHPNDITKRVFRIDSSYSYTFDEVPDIGESEADKHSMSAKVSYGAALPGQSLEDVHLIDAADGFELPLTLSLGFEHNRFSLLGEEGYVSSENGEWVERFGCSAGGVTEEGEEVAPYLTQPGESCTRQQELATGNAATAGVTLRMKPGMLFEDVPKIVKEVNVVVNGNLGVDLDNLDEGPFVDHLAFGGTAALQWQFK